MTYRTWFGAVPFRVVTARRPTSVAMTTMFGAVSFRVATARADRAHKTVAGLEPYHFGW